MASMPHNWNAIYIIYISTIANDVTLKGMLHATGPIPSKNCNGWQ